MSEPLISVVIPTFNRRAFLSQALRSVLAQEYANVEVIVMDGASTDGTQELLAELPANVRVESGADSGPFEAIEKGWALAGGEILTWLNDDDLWLPGTAATVARQFASRPDADVIYGGCLGIDVSGRVIWFDEARPWSLAQAVLDSDHVINQPAAFIRREAALKADGLVHEWVHDHDLWIRMGVQGATFVPVSETLAAVRIHRGNRSMEPRFALAQKQRLLEAWLADRRVPREIRRNARRARSNAYIRGFHYLDPTVPAHWWLGLRWLLAAANADITNAGPAVARGAKLAYLRYRRPSRLAQMSLPERLGEE